MPPPDPLFNSPGVKDLFLKVWNAAPDGFEAAAWILKTTSPPAFQLLNLKVGGSAHVNVGNPPHGVVAQVHTHPRKLDPRPSTSDNRGGKGDWDAAINSGVPVYVLSIWAIWKILPDKNNASIMQVAKDWIK